MKKILAAFALCGVALASQAEISVEIVRVHQRWPWETKIDVDYVLSAPEGVEVDLNPRFCDGETELNVPLTAISGDVWSIRAGSHRLTVDPMKTAYVNEVFTRFTVKFDRAAETPLYMVVDLT
jgi:hypothetical protein